MFMKKVLEKHRKLILFVVDTLIIIFSFLFAFRIFNSEIGNFNLYICVLQVAVYLTAILTCRFFLKTYDSIWRYADEDEYIVLILADVLGYFIYSLIALLLTEIGMIDQTSRFSLSYMTLVFLLSLLVVLMVRFAYKSFRIVFLKKAPKGDEHKIKIAIIGAGYAGATLVNEIKRDHECKYKPYYFFDSDQSKIGSMLHDIKVIDTVENMPERLKGTGVKEIIIAIPSISAEEKVKILDICAKTDCKVRLYEYPLQRTCGAYEHVKTSIRDIKIEDLLSREPVKLDMRSACSYFTGRTILVTGAGGSIGSEICRQVAALSPKRLIMVDIYENNAYDVQQELTHLYGRDFHLNVEIASIRDERKINAIFEKYRPEVVFHAAAHKHVPLMENCSDEAVKNNVFGTYNVILAAEKYGIAKFVLLSTDKAVNPTNIMGATKQICEMMIRSMKNSKTTFTAVRFGNVLGSNGSVIPLFKRQIEYGGPVTVTDKRIIRYFMTIPEAVQLVMQAAVMATNSEIFVLDMGNPVKILSLAENLIKLSGYVPYKDIDIVETGLRQGEKLYEELLVKTEELDKTANNKIFIERGGCISKEELKEKLNILQKALDSSDNKEICEAIKKVVPTYKRPEEVNCQLNHVTEAKNTLDSTAAENVNENKNEAILVADCKAVN